MTDSGHTFFTLIILILLGCNPSGFQKNSMPQSRLETNLVLAGKNRAELEKVLAHYSDPADSLKNKAAVFLISNMDGKVHFMGDWQDRFDPLFFKMLAGRNDDEVIQLRDSVDELVGLPGQKDITRVNDLEVLTSAYLIKNIDEAFDAWQRAPWSASVSFDAFCNYILPYKSENEPPEDWRTTIQNKYGHLLDHPDIPATMTDICCAMVDDQIWFDYTNKLGSYPGRFSFSQIMEGKKGSCNEMANMGVYSGRALGIPVAVDYVPQYGNINDVHNWNALILSDTRFINFEGTESRPGDMAYTWEKDHKFAKVYRRHMDWVSGSFAARALESGINDMPEFLTNPRILDVTPAYTRVADIKLHVHAKQGTPVYLCVSKWRSWVAIAGSFIEEDTAVFQNMGRGLVYLPMFYHRDQYEPAGPPFLVPFKDEVITLKAREDKTQTMVMGRKYPFKRSWEYTLANSMTGARFEAAADSSFQNPVLLHEIPTPKKTYDPTILYNLELKDRARYESAWTTVDLSVPEGFQFVRLIFRKPQVFRVGEIQFFSRDNETALEGNPIGNVPEPFRAFDGFPGRVIKLPGDTLHSYWTGLDLGEKKVIRRIRYIPATDGNAVQDGKAYELYYWKNKWVSAGEKLCDGLPLEFPDVPSDGVYWLNCRACNSKEERIFTYENGKQVWW